MSAPGPYGMSVTAPPDDVPPPGDHLSGPPSAMLLPHGGGGPPPPSALPPHYASYSQAPPPSAGPPGGAVFHHSVTSAPPAQYGYGHYSAPPHGHPHPGHPPPGHPHQQPPPPPQLPPGPHSAHPPAYGPPASGYAPPSQGLPPGSAPGPMQPNMNLMSHNSVASYTSSAPPAQPYAMSHTSLAHSHTLPHHSVYQQQPPPGHMLTQTLPSPHQPQQMQQPHVYNSAHSYTSQQFSAAGTSGSHVLGPASPPLSSMPATEVKLEISAQKLRDRDIVSKSDPVAVVFEEVRNHFAPSGSSEEQRWREVGRTESIKDDLSPHFKVHVTVPYRFEELQNIRIGLWDIDSKNPALTHQDFLGDVRTTLGDMVAAGRWTGKLTYPRAADNKKLLGGIRDLGTVTVEVHEDCKSDKIAIQFELSASKLDRKDLFGKSDPYVIITQLRGHNGSRKQLHKTEVIRRSLNPVWKPIRVLVDAPKGGTKKDVRLEFQVVDKDERSRDDEIGVVVTTLEEIETCPRLTIVNSKNRSRGKKKSSGTLIIKQVSALVLPTMIQYLQGGLRLHFTVAVDLTASNGDPRNPASLHFMDPITRSNQYTKALTAVANIITVYTPTDNRIAAFGFGADIDNSGSASHCFPLGLQSDPHCTGLEGIFMAYGHALTRVSLSGPTNFTPLLEAAMQLAQQREHSQEHQNFDVVLILTDGVVSDFNRTIDKIIEASHTSSLSVIIIGVGNADFKKMEIIDGDDRQLTSPDGLRHVKRDIVQFVPFRDYEHGPPERLAAAVLAELPMQCVNYFTTLDPPVLPNQPSYTAGSQY